MGNYEGASLAVDMALLAIISDGGNAEVMDAAMVPSNQKHVLLEGGGIALRRFLSMSASHPTTKVPTLSFQTKQSYKYAL